MWRRRDLALGGGEPFEFQDAYWVQGVAAFVDVRCDRDGGNGTAFAGTTHADGDRLRWEHEVDVGSLGTTGPDTAAYRLEGDDLVEMGTIDLGHGPEAYTERWEQIAPWTGSSRTGRAAKVRADGRLVSVGEFLAAVVDTEALSGGWILRRRENAWQVVVATAPAELAPSPDSAMPDRGMPDTVTGPPPLSWTLHPEQEEHG